VKIFITALAVIVLYTFTITFTQDYRQAQRNSYRLKYACEELSATAATFYDVEQYSEGYTVFDTDQSIKAIKDQIINLLSVDENGNPLSGSYWTGTLHYMVYFYDDSLVMKVYTDGEFISSKSFLYPYSHKDHWTKYNAIITSPIVVVTINAGAPRFRLKLFSNLPDVIRSVSHVWENR